MRDIQSMADLMQLNYKALWTKENRKNLCGQIKELVTEGVKRESLARKILLVDEFTDGDSQNTYSDEYKNNPIYDIDFGNVSTILTKNKKKPQIVKNQYNLLIPTFPTKASINITEQAARHNCLIGELALSAKDDIVRQEELSVIQLMNSLTRETHTLNVTGKLRPENISWAMTFIESDNYNVGGLFVSDKIAEEIEAWGTAFIDKESDSVMIANGIDFYLYGVPVYHSSNFPDNVVYVACNPEYNGVMPISECVDVIYKEKTNKNDKNKTEYMWKITEQHGMAILDGKCIAQIRLH